MAQVVYTSLTSVVVYASSGGGGGGLADVETDATIDGTGVLGDPLSVVYGTTADTACEGNDSRIGNASALTSGTLDIARIADGSITLAKGVNLDGASFIGRGIDAAAGVPQNILFGQGFIATTVGAKAAIAVDFPSATTPDLHAESHFTGGTDELTPSDIGAAEASHTHGNITNAGAIGSAANLPIITTTSGVLTTGAFGTGANQFCQGNDSRLTINERYCSSSLGDDGDDGLHPSTPKATLAAAMASLPVGGTLFLRRGDRWREQIYGATTDGVTIDAYGSGDLPTIDCSDDARVWSWSAEATGAYSATMPTSAFTDFTGKIHVGVYVDGVQLTEVASEATCEATEGTYFLDNSGSPNYTPNGRVIVHLVGGVSPSAWSGTVDITVRPFGIALRNDCTVRGIRTMRNAHDDGSLVLQLNAFVDRCECNDGSKHNCYVASGRVHDTLTYNADKRGPGQSGMTSGTMFVSYDTDPTALSVVYERCRAIVPAYKSGFREATGALIGWYAHGNSGATPYGSFAAKDCKAENLDQVFGGDLFSSMFYRCRAVSCLQFVVGGSTNAGSKMFLLECVHNNFSSAYEFVSGFNTARPIQATARSVVMRDVQIVARNSSDYLIDSISNSTTAYDFENCTIMFAPNIRTSSEGLVHVRSNQSLTMKRCYLGQDEIAVGNYDTIAGLSLVVDSGGSYTGQLNAWHGGYRADGTTPRQVSVSIGGTTYYSEPSPTGNGSTSCLWDTNSAGGGTDGTFDGSGIDGPLLPRSTRPPWHAGALYNARAPYKGLSAADLPQWDEWMRYPRESWCALASYNGTNEHRVEVIGAGHYPKDHGARLALFDLRP